MQFNRNYKQRLNRLYTFYHRIVFIHCLKILQNEQIAHDMTQDIFIKIHKNLPSFRGDSKYSTWIHTITKNTCYDHLRNTKRRFFLLEEPKNYLWNLEKDSGNDTFIRAVLTKELERIPTVLAKILHLKYMMGLNQSEIAIELGISRVAVSKRIQNHFRRKHKDE
tara:strand:+ start:242 stop:736 length:495 start_codon:yes stop_codon:yes gene_type:complete